MGSVAEYPVKFVWDRGGEKVFMSLTNGRGESRTLTLKEHKNGHHEVTVKLNVGRYEYRWVKSLNCHINDKTVFVSSQVRH